MQSKEENIRMRKTRDLLKKNWRPQGKISCKDGHNRSGMDLTEAEDVKKRGQEYTEELYVKGLMTGMVMVV